MTLKATWPGATLLIVLSSLAMGGMAWALRPALTSSDDLTRRLEEVALFVAGADPYQDPDMTYPPSAPPVFTALLAPVPESLVRPYWIVLNLIALGVCCAVLVNVWGRDWPRWLQAATALALVATKPARGGIALGQFHLMPVGLGLAATCLTVERPVLAGILMGIALIKPTMVLPLVLLWTIRRRWNALLGAGAVQAGLWLVTSIWVRIDPITLGREWVALASGQEAAGMIDWPSLIGQVWPTTSGLTLPVALVCLMVAGGLFWAFRHRDDRDLVPIACFVAAVFTYHRPYDLVLLFPALVWFIDRAWKERYRSLVPTLLASTLAIALIWPSHPSVTGSFEFLYAPIFVPLAHVMGTILVFEVAREGRAIGDFKPLARSAG